MMKASAQSLLAAVQEHSRPRGVDTAPEREAIVQTYRADLKTQVQALQEHMPILQWETRRRAMVLANVDTVREMVNTYEAASSILKDVALMLSDSHPAECEAVTTVLGDIQHVTDILINELDTRQAGPGLIGEAKSLLARATQDVNTTGNEAQTAQLRQTFHALVASVRENVESLEEDNADEQDSAPVNPSTFRFKLAQIRTCENVATWLESVLGELFNLDSEEYGRIQIVLDDIQDRTDVLFNDTKAREFDAEFISLHASVDGLENEIGQHSSPGSNAMLPFWRRKRHDLSICDTRRHKLDGAEEELFGEGAAESSKIKASLNAMEDRIDALITDVEEKIHEIHRRDSIPEEDPDDVESLTMQFNRMSTFGSLPDEQ